MNQNTHFAPLEVILPHIHGDEDQCVQRLQELLSADPALEKVHLKRFDDKAGLCIHYNPDQISLDQLKSLVSISGAKIADRYKHKTLTINGMDCADCANIIEHALGHLDGVLAAKVGYASQQLRIEYNNQEITLKSIVKHLKKLGYRAEEQHLCQHSHDHKHPDTWLHKNGELFMSAISGIFLALGFVCSFYFPALSTPAYVVSFAAGGLLTFRDSIQTLMQKRFDIDVLMIFAAIGAAAIGEWADGSLLLFLFSLGHSLEHKAMHHAQEAVRSIAKLAPNTALVLRDGVEQDISVENLRIDDLVMVKPGQAIPIDGVIVQGMSSVDQSPITGESIPVDKVANDTVFAGSINGQGLLRVRVTKRSEDSTISRMVRLVMEADTQKSPTQRFTDRFVKIFVPSVLLGVLLLIFIPPLMNMMNWESAFYRAMAVLVAASPCALAISTPAAVLSAVACAAHRGVLIKGGAHLENLGSIKAIAFDKTGTLTLGKPHVQQVVAFSEYNQNQVLQLAASAEKYSHHPLAIAVVAQAQNQQLPLLEVDHVQEIMGNGIRAELNALPLEIGAPKMFTNMPEELCTIVDDFLNRGHTLMIIRHGEQWVGMIALADDVRPHAKEVIEKLHEQGIQHTIMLTGDNHRVAQSIAQQIGIDHVLANLLPEDKLAKITELEKQYRYVAMVGDGINDAPALARATVGISMGGAGMDVALEASDVSLMANDLTQLPFAIRLSRKAEFVIKFNLSLALGVVVILLGLTATGYAGIGPTIIAHEGSTLFVVLNALRLLRAR